MQFSFKSSFWPDCVIWFDAHGDINTDQTSPSGNIHGIPHVIEKAIEVASNGTDGIHVSFDVDCMDPVHAVGTGTRVPGGMTYRESHFALEMIAQSNKVVSAEFVEVNPIIDVKNQTAKNAVALIGSLMGEWLL